MIDTRHDTTRIGAAPRLDGRAADRIRAYVATLVFAWATGLPMHSVENSLPHPGKQTTPYLGV